MEEHKHFFGNCGVIHPGRGRRGSATIVIWWTKLPTLFWNLLSNALMRPDPIEILDIGMKDTIQLPLLKDEKVIETLSSYTSQKVFTDRTGA